MVSTSGTFTPVRTEKNGMRRFGDSRDILITEFEIEKDDVLKFKPVYESLHGFFTENGFEHPLTEDDKIEDLYWERWTPSGAKEQHIWWRVKRDITPYIRHYIELNYQTLNVKPFDAMHKGKKYSVEKNDFIVRVKVFLQWDIKNKFRDSLAWKFKKVFFNKIYYHEMETHKRELLEVALRLQRQLKSLLEMPLDKEHPATFEPPSGFKEY